MSDYRQEIENYGQDVDDFEGNPFESVRMLHDRSELHRVYEDLTFQDKIELAKYDLQLIRSAKQMLVAFRPD